MLGAKWEDAIETTIRGLSGLHSPVISPDSLLLAASSALERLKKAEGGGAWVKGLPTEPGSYWYAVTWRGAVRWQIGHGSLDESGEHSYDRVFCVESSPDFDIKHKPAPPLPEAP